MDKDKCRRWFWRIFEVICYITIFAALNRCLKIFKLGYDIYWKDDIYIADGEYLGNLGDFTAGTVGSLIALLSVFLLYRTLRIQSIANHDNRILLEVQRFNDLYFNLIGLLDKEAPNKNDIKGFRKRIEQASMIDSDFESRMNAAVGEYTQIYEQHPELGTYFRTLYRILDLIATSDIKDEERVKYSKILRARFGEDEIFLMRYNSLTSKGHKLGRYLWNYHILKHLPPTSVAELRMQVKSLNSNECGVIDRLYDGLRSAAVSSDKHINTKNVLSGPFMLSVTNTKNMADTGLRLNVSVNLLKLRESRSKYPTLAAMSAKEAEELIYDIVQLFNSFAPHSNTKADLRRHRKMERLILLSLTIGLR